MDSQHRTLIVPPPERGYDRPEASTPALPFAPIPEFDEHGNLPVGDLFSQGVTSVLYTSLEHVHRCLVEDMAASERRLAIWQGWMRHRAEMSAFRIPYTTLVDGSFCTAKLNPGDVDLCYLLDATALNSLPVNQHQGLVQLLNASFCKQHFLCDVYHVLVFPFTHPLFPVTVRDMSYWTRVFGIDREGRHKAVLMVGGDGAA